jgi:hypothetical protein
MLATAGPGSAQTLTADDLARRTVERRAVEAVIWGMPAVNFELLYQATVKAGGAWNQVVYWSRPLDWKNQTLTPNPDTIYLFPFFNTKEVGPLVLEIPPADGGSITGSIDDAWQCALEDVGPAGVDKGKGGKYLILPPGYKGRVPAGYIPLVSETYAGFAVLRSNLKSGSEADIAKAVAYGKRVKIYPLAQAANPPPTKFADAADVVYDSTIPYDMRFFEALDQFVQREPWLERDKAMIDQLKSIGIEKGKAFNPDPRHPLFLCLFQCQASGSGAVLFNDDCGQGRPRLRRRWHLSTDRAGEPAGQAVLVGDRLRSRDPRVHPKPAAAEPLVAESRPAKEYRQLGGPLVRSQRAGSHGVELGSDQARRRIRSPIPLLWSRKAAVRQNLAAAGYREGRCTMMRDAMQ